MHFTTLLCPHPTSHAKPSRCKANNKAAGWIDKGVAWVPLNFSRCKLIADALLCFGQFYHNAPIDECNACHERDCKKKNKHPKTRATGNGGHSIEQCGAQHKDAPNEEEEKHWPRPEPGSFIRFDSVLQRDREK